MTPSVFLSTIFAILSGARSLSSFVDVHPGGKSIGIPGEIKSFHEMWKKFGRVKWETLFDAAIRLADEGFVVERALVQAMAMYDNVLKTDKNLRLVSNIIHCFTRSILL